MGMLLSLPMIVAGAIIVVVALRRKTEGQVTPPVQGTS
jgi:prolipoprotein diacylglyceryltransferase